MQAPIIVDAKADRRRDWALLFLSGGGIIFTLYTALCLFLIRGIPSYVFYMGLFGHIQILIVFTGILGLLVKRELKISKSEINISDHDEDLISRPQAAMAVEEALEEIPAIVPSGIDDKQG